VSHEELLKLVPSVNSGLALLSWPFVIYEVFSKSAPIANLKSNLDVRRGQLLNVVTLRIERGLQPFWPKTVSRIFVEPEYRIESPAVFSEPARDAVKECLERSEELLLRAALVRRLTTRILMLDQLTYWSVYCVAAESLVALVLWFFIRNMSDSLNAVIIEIPILTALITFILAGVRQVHHHKAQREIAREEIENS